MNSRDAQWMAAMRAARAGDRAAYERCLREIAQVLRPAVRRGLLRSGGNAADAEDVVQEILIAVHLKHRTWDETRPFAPWLAAIARYKTVDCLRRRGYRTELPIEDFAGTLAAAEPEPSADERSVARSLDALPERQREVVRTIAVEGASIAQAAKHLRISEGAVRVALHRGLAALAKISQTP